jgi:hypothetical protein
MPTGLIPITLKTAWPWILEADVEVLAVRRTGLTISGQFLAWARRHPWAAAALAALLGGAMGYLIYHLATGY